MNRKVLIISGIAFMILAGVLVGLFLYQRPDFNNRVRTAVRNGRIMISSDADIDRYFVFLSADEVNSILEEKNSAGSFKFLMPQFDLNLNGSPLVFSEGRESREGTDISYISVKGMPTGAKIYADIQGYATGEYRRDTDPPYVHVTERVIAGDEGVYRDVLKNIYFSTIDISNGDTIVPGLSEIFRRVGLTDKIGSALTERGLPQQVVKDDSQLVLIIERSGDFSLADFDNLLTKDGKIVMVKR